MEDFKTFAENVKNQISGFLPEEYRSASPEMKQVLKNNNERRLGISIRKEGWEIAPILYLEEYYQMLQEGNPETEVLQRIAREYLDCNRDTPQNVGELIPDFETAKEQLWLKLVGKESNQRKLERCVYKDVEGTDLVATFQLRVKIPGLEEGDISVDKRIMEKWGCDVDSLYESVLANMVHQMPAQVSEIDSVLVGDEGGWKPEEVSCQEKKLYILRNTEESHGAATLLYPGVLQALAENSGSDLYLLPFSPHAVAVRRVDSGAEVKKLQHLLLIMNTTKEPPGEILSNHIYRYDGKEQKLSCATTEEGTEEMLKKVLAGRERLSEQGKPDEELER